MGHRVDRGIWTTPKAGEEELHEINPIQAFKGIRRVRTPKLLKKKRETNKLEPHRDRCRAGSVTLGNVGSGLRRKNGGATVLNGAKERPHHAWAGTRHLKERNVVVVPGRSTNDES